MNSKLRVGILAIWTVACSGSPTNGAGMPDAGTGATAAGGAAGQSSLGGTTSSGGAAGSSGAAGAPDVDAAVSACAKTSFGHELHPDYDVIPNNGKGNIWFDVTTTSDGDVVATGWYWGRLDFGSGPFGDPLATAPNVALVRWSSDGTLRWAKSLPRKDTASVGTALELDENGGVFWGGAFVDSIALGSKTLSNDSISHPLPFVAHVNGGGDVTWAVSIESDDDRVVAMVRSGGSLFVLLGDYPSPHQPEDIHAVTHHRLLRLDPNSGAIQSQTSVPGFHFAVLGQWPSLAKASDGGVYLSYQTQEWPVYPAHLIKFSADGSLAWTKTFDKTIPGEASSFALLAVTGDPSGGAFAITTGNMEGFAKPSVTRFDPNGVIVWSKPIGDFGERRGIHAAADGSIYFVGPLDGTECSDLMLSHWSKDGDSLGVQNYTAPGSNHSYPVMHFAPKQLAFASSGSGDMFVGNLAYE